MADRIAENAYALPEKIPYYTRGGLPFAYPPFGFYLAAVLLDLVNISPMQLARILPGIITVGYLIPAYFFAEEILGSSLKAGLSTIILAVNPPILQWHISAGGFVRASAFLFTIIGLYSGLRLFRDHDRRWLLVVISVFTLTILSHPQYTIFFVASIALLWFVFDRSWLGFQFGIFIGISSVLLTAPWWGQVIRIHGYDVFLAAAGSQGGIGTNLSQAITMFNIQLWNEALFFFLGPFSILGSVYLIFSRRLFLPAWLVLAAIMLEKARFPYFVGTLLSVILVVDGARLFAQRFTQTKATLRICVGFICLLFTVTGLLIGTFYVTSSVDTHAGSQSLPQFIDDSDIEAMQWAQQNTTSETEFVVLGDAAEWFPQQAHRTILVGPWGVEWNGENAYRKQIWRFRHLSTCDNSKCVSTFLHQTKLNPEYVYVPKGEFTIRGNLHHQSSATIASFRTSPLYQPVFENSGVVIFQYDSNGSLSAGS